MPQSLRLLVLCLPFALAGPSPLHAQEPDTTVADTTQAPSDTVQASPESEAPRLTAAQADSVARARRQRATDSARAAAKDWLSLTDAGHFDQSWDAADSVFQAGVEREAWIDQGRRARARLDTLQSRHLIKTQYRDSTDQLPGGSPVVLFQYASTFGGGSVLEAVVTTHRDTAWTVAGYRVVPAPTDSTIVPPDSTQQNTPE
jgi:hypothetical protein